MRTFLQDVRFAFRQFAHHTGFALTAVLSLALGVGATVSVFSIVYAVLMNPWPYSGADRISTISFLDKAGNEDRLGRHDRPTDTAATTSPFAGRRDGRERVEPDRHRRRCSGRCPGNLPDTQRFPIPWPAGDAWPNFLPSDAPDGQEPQQVVVLSHKFWQRHFNGDPSVVGKPIQLVHKTYTILGVLPPRFTW